MKLPDTAGGVSADRIEPDLVDALLAAAVREGAYNAATEARMAMAVTDQADEYTCSVCAAQIRKWATDETSITEGAYILN